MSAKASLFAIACFILFVDAMAGACVNPKRQVKPGSYYMPDYVGTWYSQGYYDSYSNSDRLALCEVSTYGIVVCGPGCINSTALSVSKIFNSPCGNGSEAEYKSNIVKDEATGVITTYTLDAESGEVTGSAPCYLIAGKAGLYNIFYCCREYEGGYVVEALYYHTATADPVPNLTMRMHKIAKKAGLSEIAAKVIFMVPGTCA